MTNLVRKFAGVGMFVRNQIWNDRNAMRWVGKTGWLRLLLQLTLALQLSTAHSHVDLDGHVMQIKPEPDVCEYIKASVNEPFARAMLHVARERVNAQDYDQPIRHMHQAFECIDGLQVDGTMKLRSEDDQSAFLLHYEYAELLRMHVLPRGSTVDAELADQWKRDAIKHYRQTIKYLEEPPGDQVVPTETRLHVFNTIGLLLLELGQTQESIQFFRQASTVDPDAIVPLGNAILALASLGDVEGAFDCTSRALEAAPNDPRLLHNVGVTIYKLGNNQAAADQWTQAMNTNRITIEMLWSLKTYFEEQGDSTKALFYLNQIKQMAESAFLVNPTSVSAQENFNAVRLKLATAQLPMIYESSVHIDQVRSAYIASLQELVLASESGSFHLPKDPAMAVGSGSMGYYAIFQGYNDVAIRFQLAKIYRNAMPSLSYTAPHVRRLRHKRFLLQQLNEIPEPDVVLLRERIRVGFHLALMHYQSVDILTQGLIRQLSRDKFEVVLILDEADIVGDLARDETSGADFVLHLSKDLSEAQQQVGKLELDVLVFTEIGMHSRTYFLAFAQLALRTVMLWRHPVTSGIDTIDYFISSRLFDVQIPDKATETPTPLLQEGHDGQYTECVYPMELFTAYVDPPTLSSEFQRGEQLANLRSSLGLPSAGTMFLVSQPLHKIHPTFDPMIERILDEIPDSFLVLPTGAKPLLVDQLTARWRRRLSENVYKRIFFVRALNETEFLGLCAMADIVLDTFPVGGSGSSLAIFSVGTPVVVHVTRTTVLQLTAAMYRIMGIDDWLAFTDDAYVENAIRLAQNATLRHELKQRILANKHKLFNNEAVVSEWETLLLNIMALNPPSRSSRISELGVLHTKNECSANIMTQLSSMAQTPDHQLIEYQLHALLPVIDPLLQPKQYFLATLPLNDDPFQAAKLFCEQFEPPLDGTHLTILGKLFWNMRNRLLQPIMQQWTLDTPEYIPIESIPIEIRHGDGLDQVFDGRYWMPSEDSAITRR